MSGPSQPAQAQASSSAAASASASSTSTSTAALPELPWSFHECPTETLVVLISHMLNLLIQHNDQVVLTPDSLTRFHSRAAPGITVVDYLQRIVKYTNMEKIPLLSLLAYIDITCTNLPTFTLSSLTVHRFLIAGVCAGSKAQCDVFCTNSHYAKVGGIKVTELNGLEREFLKVTQWDLCCKAELLQQYYTSLIKSHGGFTQAAEPAENPLASLPHPAAEGEGPTDDAPMREAPASAVAARIPADTAMTSSTSGGVNEQPPQPVDIPLPPNKRGRRRESQNGPQSMPEQINDTDRQASFANGAGGKASPTVNSAPGSTGRMGMDVDVDEDESPMSNDRLSHPSPASSSIPSSSRSSLRGRNVSMTQLDPSAATAASPRVDMTAATGRVGMEIDADTNAVADAHANAGGDQPSADNPQPPSSVTAVPTGHPEPSEHEGRTGHTGGKLLKSLVGGIFRRSHDPAHHSDPPAPAQQQHQAPTQSSSSTNTQRLVPPHQSPGRRVKSPLMNPYPQGEPPALAAPVTPRVRTRGETTSEC